MIKMRVRIENEYINGMTWVLRIAKIKLKIEVTND